MNREQVKAALPVIQAFAEGRPVQFRDLRPGSLSVEWLTLNPDTTEFRLSEFDPREWRAEPGQDVESHHSSVLIPYIVIYT